MSSATSPTISVVVATHNYARFVPDALRSVVAQTYADWECVVVDDASTDDTCAVVQSFVSRDSRFRYIRNERNLGEAGSRNAGNAAARGKYIAVLDADDWWDPEKLRLQLEAIERAPAAIICFTDSIVATAGGERRRSCPASWTGRIDSGLRRENLIVHSSVVVARDAIAAVGGYDGALPPAADWDLWLRLLARFGAEGFAHVAEPLTYYRVHGNNMSSNFDKLTHVEWIVIRRSLLNRAWWLRHPIHAKRVLEEQSYRQQGRLETLGKGGRAFGHSCFQLLLGPYRRWKWGRALQTFRVWRSQRC